MTGPSVVLFRQDLRLADNPALRAAVDRGQPVVPLYVWAPADEGEWPAGAASRWWLHQSLSALDATLRRRGSRLVVRSGRLAAQVQAVARASGATHVYWNRRYEPAAVATEHQLQGTLQGGGCQVEISDATLLTAPGAAQKTDGGHYQVFTPFYRTARGLPVPEPVAEPPRLPAPASWPPGAELEALRLQPQVDWAAGLRATWTPGEAGAWARADSFAAQAITGYAARRDLPAACGTSRLSPHLHFGEISPRQLLPMVTDSEPFVRQLYWREFAYQMLMHEPQTPSQPLRREFARFPWDQRPGHWRAWRRGRTGYPLVDAGMRELWATGWMHNRVRMVAASFLIKHLLIPWQQGAAWFWDTLVDADLANNTFGWQWTAGSGADAAPYFRIFNPTLQAARYAADGRYIRRWVPELARLDDRYVRAPWQAPAAALAAAGVELGGSYPLPLVDHQQARTRALAAYRQIKSDASSASDKGRT